MLRRLQPLFFAIFATRAAGAALFPPGKGSFSNATSSGRSTGLLVCSSEPSRVKGSLSAAGAVLLPHSGGSGSGAGQQGVHGLLPRPLVLHGVDVLDLHGLFEAGEGKPGRSSHYFWMEPTKRSFAEEPPFLKRKEQKGSLLRSPVGNPRG